MRSGSPAAGQSREAFARELAPVCRARVRVAATADEAFDGADILVEASRLTEPEPLLRTAVVKPGAFVVPYGTVSAVELDLLDVMDKVVVDDWREAQSGRFGALRRHVDTGRLSAASLHAELGQIVTGRRPGRERDDERILLWHRGLAILDIAVGLAILRRAEAGRRDDAPVPLAMAALTITEAGDPDLGLVRAVAAGQAVVVEPGLLDAVQRRCDEARLALRDGRPVYGVNTGMGALSAVRLTEQQQLSHQRNLLLARATGGPPWLDPAEVRALITVRLLTFLSGDAAVSAGLCRRLAEFLDSGIVPAVPARAPGPRARSCSWRTRSGRWPASARCWRRTGPCCQRARRCAARPRRAQSRPEGGHRPAPGRARDHRVVRAPPP